MTMKYIELLSRLYKRGLFVLALILGPAFAFAIPTQATVTDHAATGNTSGACAAATPSLSLLPSSQHAEAGASLEYTVTLTNNDDKACGASSFDLTVTYLPNDWTADLSKNALTLMPGAMGIVTLSVTPEADAASGSYRLQVAVSDARDPIHAKASTASYVANDTATDVANVGVPIGPTKPVAGQMTNQANTDSDPGTANIGGTSGRIAHAGATIPAAGGASTTESGNAKDAERLTLRLTGLLTAYNHASTSAKANALEELVAAAEERHALLTNLIATDPGAVLRVAVPTHVRESMPAQTRTLIEQHLDLEGELEVLYEDHADGRARLSRFLTSGGKRIALAFKDSPPIVLSGKTVAAHGVYVDADDDPEADGIMALSSGDSILMLASGGGTDGGSNGGTPAPLPGTLGEQRTLVIAVNFANMPAEKPWTVSEIGSAFFGTVSDFFLENSFGQTWLNGDVYGWYTLPIDSSTCDMMGIETAAKAAATASGASIADYSHLVYVFPQNSSCAFSGTSTVGGSPSRSWINGDLALGVIGHELGHAMGLYHGHSWACEGATLGSNCTSLEYGDGIDIMGWSPSAHFNPFNKERLGWLNNGALPPITLIQSDGTYLVESYSTSDPGPKALKLYKGVDPSTGRDVWYYIEYRQPPVGLNMMDSDNIFNGVVVRTGSPEQNGNTSYLLDMTPETYQLYTRDPALTVGKSYVDAEAGVTITTLWTDGTSAGVNVSFGAQSCVRANPSVVVSPSEGPWVDSGTPVTYTVTLTNNDGAACPASDFILTANIPVGWVSTFANSSVTLAPGANTSTTLAVTSTTSTPDGFYGVAVTDTNSTDPAYTAFASATYVIGAATSSPTDQPPVAVDDTAVLSEIAPITIDALANDSDPDGDPLRIVSVTQGTKGTVTINADGTLEYSPGKRFKDSDKFIYDISDGTDTATAAVSINLQTGSGSGRGPKTGGNGNGK